MSSGLSERYVSYLQLLSNSWSSSRAASLLDKELVCYIAERFMRCSTPLKVRILLSLLHMNDSEREGCVEDLEAFLQQCELDSEDWVRKLSRLLMPYCRTGAIDATEIDTEFAYRTIQYLDEQREERGQACFALKPPIERTQVFDVLQDPYYPLSGANSLPPDENALFQQSAGVLPPRMAEYLLTLPPYQVDTTHFTPRVDLGQTGKDLCAAGLAVLAREWQQAEAWNQRRSKRFKPGN